MGREVRRVPANWEHPRRDCHHSPWAGGCSEAKRSGGKCYQPLHDRSFSQEAAEWKEGLRKWESGEDKDRAEHPGMEWWEWHGDPPNREYYQPEWKPEDMTHYQVYETVSEGTPVTPHFATPEELIDYLVAHGDYWDQYRGHGGWSRQSAEQFIGRGFAMSLMVQTGADGVKVHAPRDGDL